MNSPQAPTPQSTITPSLPSSSNDDLSLEHNMTHLEAPLVALISQRPQGFKTLEEAQAFVATLRAARKSPQTLNAMLATESRELTRRAPAAPRKPAKADPFALFLASVTAPKA